MLLIPSLMDSDPFSVAILAHYAKSIPYYREGLAAVSRSMPTSSAIDRYPRPSPSFSSHQLTEPQCGQSSQYPII